MGRRRPARRAALTRPPHGQGEAAAELVRIERIAAGGDGVGRLADGRVVFVPRTAPGDAAELVRIQRQKSFARAVLGRVVVPGAGRVEPRCPHYVRDRCGGCQLQHLASDHQQAARQGIVGDALRRVGRLPVDDPPLEPAPQEWAYRTRITLHAGASGRIGFHRLGQPGEVFELEYCHVATPDLNHLWTLVRANRTLLPTTLDTLTLRRERGGRRHVMLRGTDTAWPDARRFADVMCGAEAVTWWQPAGGAARVIGAETAFPATVFEQVSPAMGDRVRQHAVAMLGDVRDEAGWDLYAGIGETSTLLRERGARVESVELDLRAVQLAQRLDDSASIRRHAGPVEDIVPRLGEPGFVVANPPRTGMNGRVVDVISAHRPRRLVYISCDPATLARDLRRLGDGWQLRHIRAFDLFPQTAHVETVALVAPI